MSHPEDPAAASSAAEATTKYADEDALKKQVTSLLGPGEAPPQTVEVACQPLSILTSNHICTVCLCSPLPTTGMTDVP